MSQDHQTTQGMSNGILDNKPSKPVTNGKKKRKSRAKPKPLNVDDLKSAVLPMPKPEPEPVKETPKAAKCPDGVIDDFTQLDALTAAAVNDPDIDRLLVDPSVIKSILRDKYKDDAMMIYKNMPIYDFRFVDETERQNALSTTQKLFGHSKVSIGNNAIRGAHGNG